MASVRQSRQWKMIVEGACQQCQPDPHSISTPVTIYHDQEFVLFLACENGHAECLKACLAAGANVNV